MSLKEQLEEKIDNVWVGVILGLIFPFTGFYSAMLFYAIEAYETWYILTLKNSEYFSDILTFVMLPNMFLFWLFFFYFKTDKASKGLIASTLAVLGVIFLSSN